MVLYYLLETMDVQCGEIDIQGKRPNLSSSNFHMFGWRRSKVDLIFMEE